MILNSLAARLYGCQMSDAEQIMKRCQVGTRNQNEANNLHAECYIVIGRLLQVLYKDPKPCPTCEALCRTVMLDQTSHDTQRKPFTESMIKAGLDELKNIRQTEFVGDYELIKRLLEAAHNIKENT
jgi:hypothetical protein